MTRLKAVFGVLKRFSKLVFFVGSVDGSLRGGVRAASGLIWERRLATTGRWEKTDGVPLNIRGRRAADYRGGSAEANYGLGRWRVSVVTEDDRSLGSVAFDVVPDPGTGLRVEKTRRM